MKISRRLLVALLLVTFIAPAQTSTYNYIRIGNHQDVATKATAGYALMGGGSDLDQAFRFLCEKGTGGDFLILRAAGGDDYNAYVKGLCKANSVATLIIPSREAANDPKIAEIIRDAAVVFIAGGDQARYLNWWLHTPVEDALNAHITAGKPIGGTSAGLAVLGEYIYSAQGDAPDDADLTSAQALANAYFQRVTVRRDFLKIDLLRDTLTDTHFAERDRMGRTLAFLARIACDGWSQRPRAVAVDEKSALLVEANGKSTVVGTGKGAYFLHPTEGPQVCKPATPLTLRGVSVYKVPAGGHFDLRSWTGDGGTMYSLSVDQGQIRSTQPSLAVY